MTDDFNEIQGPVDWQALKPHCERKALYWVMQELDLETVFEAVIKDNATLVKEWLKDNLLKQAKMEDGKAFEESASRFQFVIASPYVLAKLEAH